MPILLKHKVPIPIRKRILQIELVMIKKRSVSKHIISSSQKGRESEIRDNFETIGSVHTNKIEKKNAN